VSRAFLPSAVLVLSATAAAWQETPGGTASIERPVVTAGRGPQKLRVDVPLLVGGQRFASVDVDSHGARARGGLGDLRLFDRTGREIGYLLIDPPRRRAGWIDGSVLEIAQTKKTSGFEVDLGRAALIDAVAVEGLVAPFLKRLVLEGSGDRARWTVLSAEGTLFDLPDERVRQTTLEFTPGSYRYLRVTWDDTNSGRLGRPRHVRAREGTSRPRVAPIREGVPFERQASEPGRSRYRLRLPGVELPIVALVFDVGPRSSRVSAAPEPIRWSWDARGSCRRRRRPARPPSSACPSSGRAAPRCR